MRIVFQLPDGSIELYNPRTKRLDDESDEEYLDRVAAHIQEAVPRLVAAVRLADLAPELIPVDRTFRNAWRGNAGGVSVDMPAAREIQKERLRQLRAPVLAQLDIDLARAQEQNRPPQEIAALIARKQALRDITTNPAIAAARTPEELKVAGMDVITGG